MKNISRSGRKAAAPWMMIAVLVGLGIPARVALAQGSGLEVLPVKPNFYMIAGAGANIGVQIGPDGVVLVDAGSGQKTADSPRGDQEVDRRADPLRHQHRRPIRITSAAMRPFPKPGARFFPLADTLAVDLASSYDQRRRGADSGGRRRPAAHERAHRAAVAISFRGVAQRNLQQQAESHVHEWRGRDHHASARRPQRRRQLSCCSVAATSSPPATFWTRPVSR